MNMIIKSVGLCCAFLPLSGIAADSDIETISTQSSWDFSVEVYGQLTNIDGSTQVGSGRVDALTTDLNLSSNDIFSKLKMAGMVHTEGLHRSGFGYSFDYAFMNLDSSPVNGLLHQGVLEAKGFKRYEYDFGTLDYMVGIRWWDITLDAGNVEPGVDWIDYVVGVRYRKQLATDWTFETLVDVGAGSDTQFTGQINSGVRYAMTDWSELHVAYKAVWVDYDNGNNDILNDGIAYRYDTVTHGLVVGWNIKF